MFADSEETIASSWDATVSQTGTQVSAVNAGYNGSVAAGSTATFGMVVDGPNSSLSALSCTAT
jgi:hypothetical protein